MSNKMLLATLSEGEGLFQEFKTSLEKVDRTLVAFANTQGGTIYLGVDDDGRPRSFSLSNRMKAQIHDLAKNIDPPLRVHCTSLGPIAAITVKEGEDKPYKCSDGFFMRVGATNQKLARNEILELALRFNQLQFEKLQNTQFKYPKDFSRDRLNTFVTQSNLDQAFSVLGVENFLISLGVCEKQRGQLIFNHAGILFFAKNLQTFMPQAKISYARYQGISKTHVVERFIYTGTLPEQLDAVCKKLKFDVPVSYKFRDSETRQERSHYPLRALEEAVTNAIIHRDYSETGAEISIDFYSDRITLSNPGTLPKPFCIKDIENKTFRRNPILAELFYRIKMGEKLGSGIARMKGLMNEWNLLPPLFEHDGIFFSVTFTGPKQPVSEEKLLTLSPRQVAFVEKRSQILEPFVAQTYSALMQVTPRTAQKDLTNLCQKSMVQKEGAGKNTRYRFVL